MRTHVAQTSWNFFSILGIQPLLGRGFSAGEDTLGRNAIAVIGYGIWQQLFAGDRRVLGSSIRVNGIPLTIIGVAPLGFNYPAKTVLWKAAGFNPGNNGWETIARLKPGIAEVQPAPLTTQSYSILDGHVLGFTVAVSMLSGLFFGVLPSLDAGRIQAFGVRGSSGMRSSRLIRETLVAVQVMLTLILLTASVSVGRGFIT